MLLVPFPSFLLVLPPRVKALFAFRGRLPRLRLEPVLLAQLPEALAALGVALRAVAVAPLVAAFPRHRAEGFDLCRAPVFAHDG